jgi:hypothetical protein
VEIVAQPPPALQCTCITCRKEPPVSSQDDSGIKCSARK